MFLNKFFVAVVATVVAVMISFAMAFTPPDGLEVGALSNGDLFVKASRTAQVNAKYNPIEIRTELKVDDNQDWIQGIKMTLEDGYYVYHSGVKLDVGSPVQFCFVLGANFYMPDCFMKAKYRPIAREWIDWNTVKSNGIGGYNFRCFVVAAK